MSIQTIGLKFDAGDLNRGVQASNQTLDSLGASAKRTGESVDQMIARMKASNLAQIEAAEAARKASGAVEDLGGKAAATASSTGLMTGALSLLARSGALIIAVETGMKVLGAAYEYVARKSIELDDANKKASDGLRQQADRDVPALAKAYIALNATLDRQVQLREKINILDRVASVSERVGSVVGGIFPTLGGAIRGVGGVSSVIGGQTRDALAEEQSRTGLARRGISDEQLNKAADLVRLFATSKKLGTDTALLATQAGEAAKLLQSVVADLSQSIERRNEAQSALNTLIEKQSKAQKAAKASTEEHLSAVERMIEAQTREAGVALGGADGWTLYKAVIDGATDAQIKLLMQLQETTAEAKRQAEVMKQLAAAGAGPGTLTPTVRGDNSRGLYNPVVGTGPDTRVEVKASADFFTETWQRAAFDVGRTLTDTFRAFFDGTKSAMETLLDGLASIASSFFGAAVNAGIGSLIKAPVLHGGGVVGSAGGSRSVSPMLFAGARRYHTGGMAGLAPDEVPAILQRGEMVIPRGGSVARESAPSVSVVLNVSSLDPVTARDLLLREMPTILKNVADAASRSRMYRAQLQGG